jgi:perosamine synthetase
VTRLKNLAQDLLAATRRVTGPGDQALHEPLFGDDEFETVSKTLRSTMVSSVGLQIVDFENRVREFTGAKFAVATVNGTAALQIALESTGLIPGDEVLLPSLTFAATASAIVHAGGTPVFIDSKPETVAIDPISLRSWLEANVVKQNGKSWNKGTGNRIHAIVPVHIFGHPAELDDLVTLCAEFNLLLVEDAAESLGSFYKNQHTGTFGIAGIISFNGNKTITTGGGGMVVTNSEEIANRVRHLITTAKLPHPWEYVHDAVGYNFRLPNLNASLGVAQMRNLGKIVQLQRRLYQTYEAEFRDTVGIRLLSEPKDTRSNYWLQTVLLDDANLRDQVIEVFHADGLKVRPAWRPLHLLEPYKKYQKTPMPGTENVYSRLVNLPSSPKLAVL